LTVGEEKHIDFLEAQLTLVDQLGARKSILARWKVEGVRPERPTLSRGGE
jgi:hypothetical protein